MQWMDNLYYLRCNETCFIYQRSIGGGEARVKESSGTEKQSSSSETRQKTGEISTGAGVTEETDEVREGKPWNNIPQTILTGVYCLIYTNKAGKWSKLHWMLLYFDYLYISSSEYIDLGFQKNELSIIIYTPCTITSFRNDLPLIILLLRLRERSKSREKGQSARLSSSGSKRA